MAIPGGVCGDDKICTARFLPECAFRGREKHKLRFAVLVEARARYSQQRARLRRGQR
jgi:hypothetical protein